MNPYQPITRDIYDYMLEISLRENPVAKALREWLQTNHANITGFLTTPDQAQFLAFLIKLLSAKHVLEIGTFVGYSTLIMAEALSATGKIITCDINKEWTAIAEQYWQQAQVQDKIDLRLRPAIQTLQALQAEQHEFDLIYIDADKENYPTYLQYSLELLAPKGVIILDNTLRVTKGAIKDIPIKGAEKIDQLNHELLHDQRFELSVLTVGSGMTLLMKRHQS